jgi:1,2-dihydroxy-3-keto-5-methylthiopentene dioxygenase
MAVLFHPKSQTTISDVLIIKDKLAHYGVEIARWQADKILKDDATQEMILEAYAHELKPYMQKKGFKTADVINVHQETPNIQQLREKFIREHTHSEDEVRFFVDGSGEFWFHFDDGEVYSIKCTAGDFISVPAGFKHWFDLAPEYFVKAIRIFSNTEGWIAQYTESGIEKNFSC